MDKPLLFLDVDGVLNVFDESGTPTQMPNGFPVWIPEGTSLRLELLAQKFDIVWATAWMGSAHPAFKEVLDLPDHWPHISWTQLKLTEIIKWAGDRPWAWVDDDIQFELDYLGWDRDRMIPDNVLLKDIDPNVGLTDQDTHDLLKFAYEQTASDPTEFV